MATCDPCKHCGATYNPNTFGGGVHIADYCRDALRAQLATSKAGLAVVRSDVLDLLKTCGIQPAGVMTFAEDLLAAKRYVGGLLSMVTEVLRAAEEARGLALGEAVAACDGITLGGASQSHLEAARSAVREVQRRIRALAPVAQTQGGADVSECGRYRYRLWRDGWSEDDRACLFVMLNPSTADAMTDDPTIRKCVGFCKRWGFGRLFVCNLFALRSTKPAGLLDVSDPVGPENDVWLQHEAEAASRIVLAWGSHHGVRDLVARRRFEVRLVLDRHWTKTTTLGHAKDGNPRHPLMLAYETAPENVRSPHAQ